MDKIYDQREELARAERERLVKDAVTVPNELLDCVDRPNRQPLMGTRPLIAIIDDPLPMQSAIQPVPVTESVKVDTKVEVMNKLKRASTQLMECQHIAAQANAMASDLPVFKEMTLISKRLNEMMLEVSRLRGL